MASPCTVVILVSSWTTIAVGNLFIMIICDIIYWIYFGSKASPSILNNKYVTIGEIFFSMLAIFAAMVFCTFFFYIYEKAFRKLYFMERIVDKVFFLILCLKRIKLAGNQLWIRFPWEL